MIPFKVNPKREELVKQIGFWNPRMVKGGAEALELMKNLEGEGATRREIYDETGKKLDPKVDAGMFRGADDLPRVHSSDEMMKIKKETGQFFHPTEGGTTDVAPLAAYVDHPLLFERAPSTANIQSQFVMPKVAGPGEKPMSGGGYFEHSGSYNSINPLTGKPRQPGYAQLFARSRGEERDINSDKYMALRDIFAHEGQHLLQDIGGTSRGTSTRDQAGQIMAGEFERLVHPRVRQYQQALGDLKDSQGGLLDPEQSMYFDEANRLFRPAVGSKGKRSALPELERYENVAGESEARRNAEYANLSAEALRALPEEQMPWAPARGAHAPFELQMLNWGKGGGFDLPDEKGTLARLLNKKMIR